MSADFRTEHYNGYAHPLRPGAAEKYIHVVMADGDYAVGNFELAELAELVQMAGQAWPSGPAVQVWYVIQQRRDGQDWQDVWKALLTGDRDADETAERNTEAVYALSASAESPAQWRLVRRTVLTAEEVIEPHQHDD